MSARQPKGIPVGGQFATPSHTEPGLTLAAQPLVPAELERYGPIPAPLEGQTLMDGPPALGTFEDTYREFFRPLNEHEAEHGPFVSSRPISEGELLALAGLNDVDLGREKGVSLEKDEETGDPLIVVHTRNGGYDAYCYEDKCDGTCNGCIQTDVIPHLPTYVRSEHEGGDSENYFRPVDPQAGATVMAAEDHRAKLHQLTYCRTAIREGTQPPWAILSPVRDQGDRNELRYALQKHLEQANYRSRDRRHADAVLEAISSGTKLPPAGMVRVPSDYYSYDTAVDYLPREEAAASEARASADALAAELTAPLPPAITALATAERARLNEYADGLQAKAQKTKDKLTTAGTTMKSWAALQHKAAEEADAKVTAAENSLKDFDWSSCFPGDLQDCPPRNLSEPASR